MIGCSGSEKGDAGGEIISSRAIEERNDGDDVMAVDFVISSETRLLQQSEIRSGGVEDRNDHFGASVERIAVHHEDELPRIGDREM